MTPADMLELGRKQTESFEEVTEQISDLTYALAEQSKALERMNAATTFQEKCATTLAYVIASDVVKELTPRPKSEAHDEYVELYDGEELGYETDAPRASIYSEDEAADLRQRGRDLKGL